jgi:hypothetical protein
MPILTSGIPSFALLAATMRSAVSASSRPAARAKALLRAIEADDENPFAYLGQDGVAHFGGRRTPPSTRMISPFM